MIVQHYTGFSTWKFTSGFVQWVIVGASNNRAADRQWAREYLWK